MEKEVYINKLKTNYKVAGKGQPVLILHGWGGSSDSWTQIQKILAAQGYKVICPDFPGFGKSESPPKAWKVADYAKWLLDFVRFLKLNKFSLIAHSFGARVAIKFAKNHPKKITKLILCASAGIKPKPDLETKIIFRITKAGNIIFTKKPLRGLKNGARNLFYIFVRNKDYSKTKGVMRETIKKILEEDLLPDLSQIRIKTLIIWGKKDKMIPVKYAYIFKENIKNSQLEILAKTGHSPHLENPEKLLEIITKFLR